MVEWIHSYGDVNKKGDVFFGKYGNVLSLSTWKPGVFTVTKLGAHEPSIKKNTPSLLRRWLGEADS